MSKAVKLSDQVFNQAKRYAKVFSRSVPGQIEYWFTIGKIAEENPDLNYKFIKEILLSLQELEDGELEEYKFD